MPARSVGRRWPGFDNLGTVTEDETVTTTLERYQARLQRVLDYIDQHADQWIDLEDLSRVALISKYHFHRWLKIFKPLDQVRAKFMKSRYSSADVTIVEVRETPVAVMAHQGDPARIGHTIQPRRFIREADVIARRREAGRRRAARPPG